MTLTNSKLTLASLGGDTASFIMEVSSSNILKESVYSKFQLFSPLKCEEKYGRAGRRVQQRNDCFNCSKDKKSKNMAYKDLLSTVLRKLRNKPEEKKSKMKTWTKTNIDLTTFDAAMLDA